MSGDVGIATVISSPSRGAIVSTIATGWGDQLVTIRALLLPCGVVLALASAASAQSPSPPPTLATPPATQTPPAVNAPAPPSTPANPIPPAALNQPGMPPQRVAALVRRSGFDPVGHPVRRGNLYVQRAIDPDAIEYRLIIDALTGRMVSIRPVGVPGPYAAAPAYGPYPPPYRPVYGRYFAPPPDDYGFGYGAPRPPRAVPHAKLPPPQPQPSAPAPQPQPSASAPAPKPQPSASAQAPLPRPKPYVMEATSSISVDAPKAPEPQKSPAPQDNGAAAMPPVAPLE